MTESEMVSVNNPTWDRMVASVVVIGYQKEDHRMYPHLYDFLKNLKCTYAEVVYLDDDDRGDGLYSFDRFVHNIISVQGCKALVKKLRKNACSFFDKSPLRMQCENTVIDSLSATQPSFHAIGKDILTTFRKLAMHFVKRRRLIAKLKNLDLRYERRFLIAIDHTAVSVATKYFRGKVALWSFDIPTKDYDSNHHMRIKNGVYEKLITARGALDTDILMIQDEKRKCLLEEALEVQFKNTIYLPVSLNDSAFCVESAESRRTKTDFSEIRIIQCGGIGKSRLSDKLIESYRQWPAHYNLTIHGVIFSHEMTELIHKARRKPELTNQMYGHEDFPSFISNYDIGFVGYAENNRNHDHIENASSQLVAFLRLGIPVIACGSIFFNDFVNKNNMGIGISSVDEMETEIEKIIDNYAFHSLNARRLFETKFNLSKIFQENLVPFFDAKMMAPPAAEPTIRTDKRNDLCQ